MKKVVHILYSGLGGHGSVVFSILKGSKNNKKVELIFYGIENIQNEYIEKCSKYGITYHFVKKKKGSHITAYLKIYSLLKNIKPDIVFIHSSDALIPASFFNLFSKGKLFFIEHQPNNIKSKSEFFLSYLAMFSADKVTFLTETHKNEVKQTLSYFFRKDKAVIIPNGIDLDFYHPKKRTLKQDWVNIGMAARFSSTKDQLTLVKAVNNLIAENYKIKLWLAGDGETFQKINITSKRLDCSIHIIMLGLLNENELLHFYQSLDIYVHSSLGETMSTSIMQAQACGLPIIASDIDGVNNVIQHNINGLLFPPTEVRPLQKCIHLLINNRSFRTKLSDASLMHAKDKLSMQKMAYSYDSLTKIE